MNRRDFLAAAGLGSVRSLARPAPPAFQFVDIAKTAGLVAPVVYGGVEKKRYILETNGCGIAFFDSDEHANVALAVARAEDLWLLPLVLDFTKATPAIGFFDHFSIAAVERLRCELVVGGDAVRYAVVDRLFPFEHVVEALSAFSKRDVLAQLPARSSLPDYVLERAPWYGEPAFSDALRSRFSEVRLSSSEETSSDLFLCRK